jgi:cation-transporting ATPase E
LRVLLVGTAERPVDDPLAPGVVSPRALIVLNQKIRPDAAETLAYFAEQRVQLKVISGDNAASVGAVTRSLGVVSGTAVDARTLPAEPAEFARVVDDTDVFGRVTPQQKRAMVKALQSKGHTVAMTGDGVNDVLALKDADLGVAMGSGSAATRAVAKIVLLDDRFATLPHVVGEGRRVIGNIERVANLFLTKTIYSALLALLVVLWRVQFPFLPIHVTITGWFTIGIPAFLLSLAPNNEQARPGFVRRVLQLGLPAGIVVGTVTFVTYLLVRTPGAGELAARQTYTSTLACLIVAATWVLAVVARPYRWWRVALVLLSLLAYLLIFTWPFTQGLFFLDIGNAAAMSTGLLMGLAGAVLIEALWWIRGRVFGEPLVFWSRRQTP